MMAMYSENNLVCHTTGTKIYTSIDFTSCPSLHDYKAYQLANDTNGDI
jgi:hypothetical protein